MTNADIWKVIKLRLQLNDDTLQPLIDTYIDEIGQRIMNYCGISIIPEGLKYTWVSMVIDAIRIDLPNISEINDTVGGGENVKIGDTSVSPASSSGVSNVSKSCIDKVVLNYSIDLNRFRNLRW